MEDKMSLQDEIIERSSKIFRDAYQMSIGELINIYRDGEMDIHKIDRINNVKYPYTIYFCKSK